MEGSVILNSPILLLMFGIALSLCFVAIFTEKPGFVLPFISALTFIAALIISYFFGADIFELIIALLIFTCAWLLPYLKYGGKKK